MRTKLILRKLTIEDLPQLIKHGNDYDIHYNSFFLMKFPFRKEEALKVIDEDKKTKNMQRFGIDLNGKIIGLIDLYNINLKNKKLKIGYWVGKTYRRRGYATWAIKKMIEYAFENFDIDEIIATTLITNNPSMNLLKKLGFEMDRVLKNDRFIDGKYSDSVQWTMKRKD